MAPKKTYVAFAGFLIEVVAAAGTGVGANKHPSADPSLEALEHIARTDDLPDPERTDLALFADPGLAISTSAVAPPRYRLKRMP